VIDPATLLRPLLDDGTAPTPTPVAVLRDRARRRRHRRHAFVAAPALLAMTAGAVAAVRTTTGDHEVVGGADVVVGDTDDAAPSTTPTSNGTIPFDAEPSPLPLPTTVEADGTVVLPVTLLDGTVVDLAYDAALGEAGYPLETLGWTPSAAGLWGDVRTDVPGADCCGRAIHVFPGLVDTAFAGRSPGFLVGPLGDVRNYDATDTEPSALAVELGPWTIVVEHVDIGPTDTDTTMTGDTFAMWVASLDAHLDDAGFVVLDLHEPLTLARTDSPDGSVGLHPEGATRVDVFDRGCGPRDSTSPHGLDVAVLGEPGTSACARGLGIELVIRGDEAFQELVAAHIDVRGVTRPTG
jgi:hypothetical protein